MTRSKPVNAAPHLGYAYELIQADVAARALRAAGHSARFTTGTDDNSLKNVLAAEAAGEDVAVERIWTAADAAGDLYRRDDAGDYCVGCERFWADDELLPAPTPACSRLGR